MNEKFWLGIWYTKTGNQNFRTCYCSGLSPWALPVSKIFKCYLFYKIHLPLTLSLSCSSMSSSPSSQLPSSIVYIYIPPSRHSPLFPSYFSNLCPRHIPFAIISDVRPLALHLTHSRYMVNTLEWINCHSVLIKIHWPSTPTTTKLLHLCSEDLPHC